MSVIIRLQNLPWSANALDIRNFFRGLSIPEGGVHIVGGELGDAFIAFSTDEDARQAMMLDGGKIKEIQVKLLLSSRSEMHKVIEAARQSVPILSLTAPLPVSVPTPAPVAPAPTPIVAPTPAPALPTITPFSAALGNLSNFGIPGIGNPQEIPQPAVIEPPAPLIPSPNAATPNTEEEKEDDKSEKRRSRDRSREKDRRRSRSRSRSRSRDRKDRKRDRRDRSRSRERRRRDRSRSRDRRDRKRDRKERSRSWDRLSPSRRSRDRRPVANSQEKSMDSLPESLPPSYNPSQASMQPMKPNMPNGPGSDTSRFSDSSITDTYNKLQELGKKRNPNAFQGEQQNGGRIQSAPMRGGIARGGGNLRGGRVSRFDDPHRNCCVAIRNAPNHTSYGDVRRFFPYLIDKHGIKMINDSSGRRTGNIYVRFCDPRSKQLALQRKINELKDVHVMVEELDDETYDNAVDSFLPYREENDDDDISITIPDHDPEQPAFTVLKLADLPTYVKEHDIIKAFSDFSLLSIQLKDCRITRSKIAHVQFAKTDDARLAFERKDKFMFGRRKPLITPVTIEEYEKEKTSIGEKVAEPPKKVHPEPQPEKVVPRDPRQRRQFEAAGSPQQQMQPTPPNQPAFFSPPFPQAQQQSFPQGGFPPQFGGFPAPGVVDPRTAASNWAARPQFPPAQIEAPVIMPQHAITTNMDDEPLDCVLMKGLPRDATDRTIVNFLADTGAVPARIHLMLDTTGMPSGDCFCEFRLSQEARMAATKHGSNLEGCRITVDLVPRSVVDEALEGPKPSEMNNGLLGNSPAPFQQQQPQMNPYESNRGGYMPRGGYRGRGGFDRNYDRGGYNRGGFDQSRGGYRGRGNYERGRGGFDRGRGRGRGRGGGNINYENGRDEESDPALADFGAPGCVVSMENVPFRATIDEILSFFSEFELTQDDIIRRFNERGQPTGDARVAFRTPFDAQRAVKTRHMDTIHDRRINLTII